MQVTGNCHCGHITYEAEVDPATVRVCHCTDCQKLTGTVFRAAIPSLPGTFVLKSGTPTIYTKTGSSGRQRFHAFCPECGTPIYATVARAEPVNLWIAVRRDRSARNNSPRQRGSNGAARRYPGRWICERSRNWTANDRSACRWAKK